MDEVVLSEQPSLRSRGTQFRLRPSLGAGFRCFLPPPGIGRLDTPASGKRHEVAIEGVVDGPQPVVRVDEIDLVAGFHDPSKEAEEANDIGLRIILNRTAQTGPGAHVPATVQPREVGIEVAPRRLHAIEVVLPGNRHARDRSKGEARLVTLPIAVPESAPAHLTIQRHLTLACAPESEGRVPGTVFAREDRNPLRHVELSIQRFEGPPRGEAHEIAALEGDLQEDQAQGYI